jgi:hypothetical protein
LLVFNAGAATTATLPAGTWTKLMDSALPRGFLEPPEPAGTILEIAERSMLLLRNGS